MDNKKAEKFGIGTVRIADEVVGTIAGLAATEVNGIAGMSGGLVGGIAEMLGKIRTGETLVVAKLDRLGRDAIDVLQTVRLLSERGIKVIVAAAGKAAQKHFLFNRTTGVEGVLSLDGSPSSDAADALACAICHAHGSSGLAAMAGVGTRKRGGRLRL